MHFASKMFCCWLWLVPSSHGNKYGIQSFGVFGAIFSQQSQLFFFIMVSENKQSNVIFLRDRENIHLDVEGGEGRLKKKKDYLYLQATKET